jgi:hypothetical protein
MKSFDLAMETLFWSSVCLIIYVYFIYPAILFMGFSLAQLQADCRYLFGCRDRRVPALMEETLPEIPFL